MSEGVDHQVLQVRQGAHRPHVVSETFGSSLCPLQAAASEQDTGAVLQEGPRGGIPRTCFEPMNATPQAYLGQHATINESSSRQAHKRALGVLLWSRQHGLCCGCAPDA